MAFFTAACVALALGTGTGWDGPTFRIFYLAGAILNVPWLALGSISLFVSPPAIRRFRGGLLLFTGLAIGVVLTAEFRRALPGEGIPSGKVMFGAFPRILAAIGSGIAAVVIIVAALVSAARTIRDRSPHARQRAGGNLLIATGTLVLAAGGTLQGLLGKDVSFVACTAVGIAILAAGTRLLSGTRALADRDTPLAAPSR